MRPARNSFHRPDDTGPTREGGYNFRNAARNSNHRPADTGPTRGGGNNFRNTARATRSRVPPTQCPPARVGTNFRNTRNSNHRRSDTVPSRGGGNKFELTAQLEPPSCVPTRARRRASSNRRRAAVGPSREVPRVVQPSPRVTARHSSSPRRHEHRRPTSTATSRVRCAGSDPSVTQACSANSVVHEARPRQSRWQSVSGAHCGRSTGRRPRAQSWPRVSGHGARVWRRGPCVLKRRYDPCVSAAHQLHARFRRCGRSH